MPIEGEIQPEKIQVDEKIRLRKYNGNIEYQENEGYLIITVVLDNTNLPKNP